MNESRRKVPVRIGVLVFDGCMTSAVTGLIDALQIANRWAVQCGVAQTDIFLSRVIAASAGAVRGSGGFALDAFAMAEPPAPDVVIVPPIMAPIRETLTANRALVAWLRGPIAGDAIVASICTGAFFLAEAHLLDGRQATTNPIFADEFRASYPSVNLVPKERLVDEGRILTAGSTTAFLDLAVHLIDRLAGHEIAVLTAKSLCIDMQHRSQLPYFLYVTPKDHGDEAVLNLQRWMEDNHSQMQTIDLMARRIAMSQRTLNRRFRAATGMTPVEYLSRLRVEAAKRFLESSDLSVEEITARVGYEDSRSFSRLFRSIAGLAPRD